jgi:Rad3-related DNA helicase
MADLQEYTRELPKWAAGRVFRDGEPILTAYECVLCELDTSKGYIYTAVNLRTGGKIVMSRRATPLRTNEVAAMVDKIRKSGIAGIGRLQADRPVKGQISLDNARDIMSAVFTEIMPRNGFAVRNEQIDLAGHILKAISKRGVTLAEAETGTGKTHGYLVPAIIAKRGRLNDFWNTDLYPEMQYAEMSKMPIVIATSSIALQRAILTEYIPQLSQMLLDGGVIKEPLTAILRKGREHYVCERNLRTHLTFESNPAARRTLEKLLPPFGAIDIADADELTPHIKGKICVSGRCAETCKYRETCQYLAFREETQSMDIDIQVCNHNYLLADTLHRANGQQPLIPNYQLLVIDEAHKFLAAARTMYGAELSEQSATDLLNNVGKLAFKRESYQNLARRSAKKLSDESVKLFRKLAANAKHNDDEEHFTVAVDADTGRCIRNMRDISDRLIEQLRDEAFYIKAVELLAWVRERFNADTSGINVSRLIGDNPDVKARVTAIHRAIRDLSEIQNAVAAERESFRNRAVSFNTESQALRNFKSKILDAVWKRTRLLYKQDTPVGGLSERFIRLIWAASQLREQASAFADYANLICWLETDKNENKLCAIPKDLGAKLLKDQWGKGISTILTSGTLSAAGDFSHIKRTLGLDRLGGKISETSKPSPFDYRENVRLYISETAPFPDTKNRNYIAAITDEIEKLLLASNGHAAVLFTGYDALGRVHAELSKRRLPFPVFKLEKSTSNAIERFKASGNGVLFASGAMWEGIDIPGDALSMLIIVKLPFAVPDPISEYERTQYPNFGAYLNSVIVPEMLIKLKQGFGRLIRTVKDTGCVAILDCRANSRGNYRERILNALPDCFVTSVISELEAFLRLKKPPEYWLRPRKG